MGICMEFVERYLVRILICMFVIICCMACGKVEKSNNAFIIIQSEPPFEEYSFCENELGQVIPIITPNEWKKIIDYDIPDGGIEFRFIAESEETTGVIYDLNTVFFDGNFYRTDKKLYNYVNEIYQREFQ